MTRPTGATNALLVTAALCNAGFWILAVVIGSFVGYRVAQHPLWIPGQLLHVLGALLVIPAIPALLTFARRPESAMAVWAGILAMIGSALFAAEGVMALSVFPMLADNARMLLEADGAMNAGIVLAAHRAAGALNMIGWILVGVALWRGRGPNWAAALLLAGGVLFNLPTGPVPLFVRAIGGLLWSAALIRFASSSTPLTTETAPMRRIRPMTPHSVDRPER